MSLYLDASAILPYLVEEQFSETVQDFLRNAAEPPFVSEFAAAEVASALSRAARMGVFTQDAATARLGDFDVWRASSTLAVDVLPVDIRLTSLFVRRFELALRAPDALHAAICRRGDLTLVTLDRRLARAAEALDVRVTCLA